MASIIVPLSEKTCDAMETYSWINWSAVAQEACKKRSIFEDYIRSGTLTDEDSRFCEKIDWHPSDWLAPKDGFIKDLGSAKKEKRIVLDKIADVFE